MTDSIADTIPESERDKSLLWARAGCGCGALLFAGLVAAALVALAVRPGEAEPPEPLISARVLVAETGEATVTLRGHGVVRSLRDVALVAELGGRVEEMPRLLRPGDRVAEGELLLRIDPRDAEAAVREARAETARLRAALTTLNVQEETDRARRGSLARGVELSQREFDRVRRLFEEENVGSANAVEAAEQAHVQMKQQLAQLDQSLAVMPARTEETRAALDAAEARLERARTQRGRADMHAPFAGRVVETMVEVGTAVSPGAKLLRLADDRSLEIRFPMDAAEVRRWVPFGEADTSEISAWFPPLPETPVTLHWSEGNGEISWEGRLNRVVSFDATTRTVMLAARIDAAAARAGGGALPLTDGMFCRVEFPGRALSNVFTLPRGAVTHDNRVYTADAENRLRSVEVEVLRAEDERVFVRGGISEGDRVVVTRLIAPLEGTRLDIGED